MRTVAPYVKHQTHLDDVAEPQEQLSKRVSGEHLVHCLRQPLEHTQREAIASQCGAGWPSSRGETYLVSRCCTSLRVPNLTSIFMTVYAGSDAIVVPVRRSVESAMAFPWYSCRMSIV